MRCQSGVEQKHSRKSKQLEGLTEQWVEVVGSDSGERRAASSCRVKTNGGAVTWQHQRAHVTFYSLHWRLRQQGWKQEGWISLILTHGWLAASELREKAKDVGSQVKALVGLAVPPCNQHSHPNARRRQQSGRDGPFCRHLRRQQRGGMERGRK